MQNSVRNMVLHPKLVKGSFSRLIQFTSCVGWPSLALLLGYCTNWIIAITTVTFRRYGRVPLKTGARSLTCYHIYHLTLLILDTVLANSADPDEMPHKAAFHLVLHCLLRKKIQTSWLSKLKQYKSRITLSACLSAHPSPRPSWHTYYARAHHCMCAYTFVYACILIWTLLNVS